MLFSFCLQSSNKSTGLIIGFFQNDIEKNYISLSNPLFNQIAKGIKTAKFSGKYGEIKEFLSPIEGSFERIIILGLGKKEDFTQTKAKNIGGKLSSFIFNLKEISFEFQINISKPLENEGILLAHLASGIKLKSWIFESYKTIDKKEKHFSLSFEFITQQATQSTKEFTELEAVIDGVFFTRELVSEPPNVLYPKNFAQKLEKLKNIGIEVEVIPQDKLQKIGMRSLLSVGQGSEKESYVVILKWNGTNKKTKPLAFVGKGVCFDTGGISLKPSARMDEMKYDMAGAGTVCGLMKAIAKRKAQVNVVGIVGLVENMPSGSALKPSDIITSLSKKTIEVLNTDAEGRLVLADLLWYTQERFSPQFMINLATLTGAIVVALGHVYAGFFSNNDKLSKNMINSSKNFPEKIWRMPLDEMYEKDIKSEVADIQNIGKTGAAGSITAAEFLKHFVNSCPWAHIDIAGVAWSHKEQDLCQKGATGYGVLLLNELIKTFYETQA